MMELIVAILIALGSLTSEADFTDEYINNNDQAISTAQSIIDNGQYRTNNADGGVVIDPGVGL